MLKPSRHSSSVCLLGDIEFLIKMKLQRRQRRHRRHLSTLKLEPEFFCFVFLNPYQNRSADSGNQTVPPSPPLFFAVRDVFFISRMWAVWLCNSLVKICDIFLHLFQPFSKHLRRENLKKQSALIRVDAKWLDSSSAWWNSSLMWFFPQILLMKRLRNEDRGIKEECLEQTVLVSSQGVRLSFFLFVLPPSFLSLYLRLPFHAFIICEQWLIDWLELTHRHC